MKIDILAIGIHPDDVELSAAGTLLNHAALGKTFGILFGSNQKKITPPGLHIS